jgi:hypothetical protein
MSTVSICWAAAVADRLEIAVADREIVLDRAAEAGEAEDQRFEDLVVLAADIDRQPPFLDAEPDPERAAIALRIGALGLEIIAFEQIEDRDAPLLLHIGVTPDDRLLVEIDGDDARIGHAGEGFIGKAHKKTPSPARFAGEGRGRVLAISPPL